MRGAYISIYLSNHSRSENASTSDRWRHHRGANILRGWRRCGESGRPGGPGRAAGGEKAAAFRERDRRTERERERKKDLNEREREKQLCLVFPAAGLGVHSCGFSVREGRVHPFLSLSPSLPIALFALPVVGSFAPIIHAVRVKTRHDLMLDLSSAAEVVAPWPSIVVWWIVQR